MHPWIQQFNIPLNWKGFKNKYGQTDFFPGTVNLQTDPEMTPLLLLHEAFKQTWQSVLIKSRWKRQRETKTSHSHLTFLPFLETCSNPLQKDKHHVRGKTETEKGSVWECLKSIHKFYPELSMTQFVRIPVSLCTKPPLLSEIPIWDNEINTNIYQNDSRNNNATKKAWETSINHNNSSVSVCVRVVLTSEVQIRPICMSTNKR